MKIVKEYPNVIVFYHNDQDGMCAAYVIKKKFDNSLQDSSWESNVTCVESRYNEEFTLDFFKDKVNALFKPDMKNIVYMVDYSIQPYDDMKKFWNWLEDKGCEFRWIDHHISSIENLRHLNIPGLQNSAMAGCNNTWKDVMGNYDIPEFINMISLFDTWNHESDYDWENEIVPLIYFLDSLDGEMNNGSSEQMKAYSMLIDNPECLRQFINIGKYIYRYVKNSFRKNCKNIKPVDWNGYKCLLLNSSLSGKLQFEEYEGYNDYDLFILWKHDGNRYNFSMYTENPDIDVSKLCMQYLNGGGHRGAAGGYSDKMVFENKKE